MAAGERTSESPDASPVPPRLRIHHLMMCAAVAAIQLTLWRNAIPAEMVDQLPVWAKLGNSIGLCLTDVGLTFALLSVYWQLKGYAALVQPGQWLLVRHLVELAQLLFGLLVVSHLRVTGPWWKSFDLWHSQDLYDAVTFVLYAILVNVNRALPALFYAWCAWRVADTRPWRVLFSLNAIINLLAMVPLYRFLVATSGSSLSRFFGAREVCSSVLILSVMVWLAVTDYRSRQRFWTHWLGVALYVAASALGLASGLIVCFGWY